MIIKYEPLSHKIEISRWWNSLTKKQQEKEIIRYFRSAVVRFKNEIIESRYNKHVKKNRC